MKKLLTWSCSTAHLVAFQKLIQAITGFLTALLVTNFLTLNEQGYFYTIGSLLSSYILLDFGLSNLLVQDSARYFSALKWSPNNNVISLSNQGESSFLSLINWTLRWYAKLGLLTLVLIPIGFIYFSFAKTTDAVAWQLPWVAVVCSLALSMPAIGFLAVLEGADKIRETYVVRIWHYLIGATLACVLLILGHGLYAQSMAPLSIAIIVYLWMSIQFKPFLKDALTHQVAFPWKTHLLPQQKKVGVSWLSNYLFLHVPVPIVFYFSGSAEAGRMGLSMVIANVSCAIAMSWVTAVTPQLSSLVAQNRAAESKITFEKALAISTILLVIGVLSFLLINFTFQESPIAQRILPPIQTLLVFITFAAFHIMNALIVYFRAFRKEPLAIPNLIATLSIVLVGCLIVPAFGVQSLIALMAIVYLALMLLSFFTFINFNSKRLIND